MAAERDAVFATRMTLTVYKGKVKGAQKGFELLKRKADALKVRLRAMMREIKQLKIDIGEEVKRAHVAFAGAEYAYPGGVFKDRVLENTHTARVRVDANIENVAGVKLPVFSPAAVEAESDDLSQVYGLGGGGQNIQGAATAFYKLVEKLIKLASLQTSFKTLDEALKVTSRRVNALDNVVVPRLTNTVSYIKAELDELEREDFTRLKKVVEMKDDDDEYAVTTENKYTAEALTTSGEGKSALEQFDTGENDPDMLF